MMGSDTGVWVPPRGVSNDRLLSALAQAETEGGRNNWPRIERSYIPAGETFTVQGHLIRGTGYNVTSAAKRRWDRWGLASAASWGPWQILYQTAADRGYDGPPHGLFDHGGSLPWVCRHLAYLQRRLKCRSVRDFADAWNSGSSRDSNVPSAYIAKVELAYEDLRQRRNA